MKEIKYPYLPEGRIIKYVDENNPFMSEAKRVRNELSTDFMQPTGAVIVKDGIVVSRAANKSKISNPRILKLHQKYCIRKLLHILSGTHYWICPGCATFHNHAEIRVTFEAKKQNLNIEGADVYLYGHWWCCEPCWKAIVDSGIKDVYLLENSEKLFNVKHPENIIRK